MSVSRRDFLERATMCGIGAILTVSTIPEIAMAKKPIPLPPEFAPFKENYIQVMQSWDKEPENYARARDGLGKIISRMELGVEDISKDPETVRIGKKEYCCYPPALLCGDGNLVVAENPEEKFTPYIAMALTYMYEGYSEVDLERLIADDENICLPEINKAEKLMDKGIWYFTRSKTIVKQLVKSHLYHHDPKKNQSILTMAKESSEGYWDYIRRMEFVAEKIPLLRNGMIRTGLRILKGKTGKMPSRDQHYPIRPLYSEKF